jgi:cation diffusion facilitator CzcD-associated flavoprotein CzcO
MKQKYEPHGLTFARYPGCKCDIPAHNYAYSFAPKPDWPNYYATSQQIHQYMHEVADKYNCRQYIRLEHSIQRAVWNEQSSKWDLTVKDSHGTLFVDHADVFINAGGVLK